ncbi:YiiX/YebB-like N1pC/P60 family cysteine hydrolase [Magnetococcus sp. PR-3]|uniref:YiiX/YebB-like N1pC/P60 family cysteine hydrolase n=1 Tax=Magnetococcus sp. PR-3 TaxID=3120355 RepID=UPI002FCE542C
MAILQRWMRRLIEYLMEESPPEGMAVCNFDRMRTELKPCDVILVEGRSRIAEVIKTITQSTWSHAALYVGQLRDLKDAALRRQVAAHYEGDPNEPLVIEAVLGKGTVVTPLRAYRNDHLRICRPHGLNDRDRDRAILYAIARLGFEYDVRQILDLGRFLLPYSIIPRRWRSSLFDHNAGEVASTVCSTMLAEAYGAVNYPILPVIKRDEMGDLKLFRRNVRLTMPRDFDHSPYFEVVKYPLLGEAEEYRSLPWDTEGWICNGARECYPPGTEILTQEQPWRPAQWAEGQMRSWWKEATVHLPDMERPQWLAFHWDDNDEGRWSRAVRWLNRTHLQLRGSDREDRGGKEEHKAE